LLDDFNFNILTMVNQMKMVPLLKITQSIGAIPSAWQKQITNTSMTYRMAAPAHESALAPLASCKPLTLTLSLRSQQRMTSVPPQSAREGRQRKITLKVCWQGQLPREREKKTGDSQVLAVSLVTLVPNLADFAHSCQTSCHIHYKVQGIFHSQKLLL
jgi:hypothetical protein